MPFQLAPGIWFWSRGELGLSISSPADHIDPNALYEFIVHHSTGSNLGAPHAAAWWRNIRDFHVNNLGYRDIAYNEGVARDPNPNYAHVLMGRGADRVGGHTRGHNSIGEAAVLLGDGRDPGQLTPGILRAFAILNFLHHSRPRVHNITTTHRRANPGQTACPGNVLDAQAIAHWPGAGGAPAPGPSMPPAPPMGIDWNVIKRMIDEAKKTVLRKFNEPEVNWLSWAVKIAQAKLDDHGFKPGPLDGIFWNVTHGAVVAFQSSRQISVDGVVGPQTWSQLFS